MKFGKSLIRVVETSDPEWGPYWMNYKFLKKKISGIVEGCEGVKITDQVLARHPGVISKSPCEVEFFRLLKSEVKKAADFFENTERMYAIRKDRIWGAFDMLLDVACLQDKNAWTRLLMATVKFYKDVLLLENFAIMNYCGFSKILKKHDKVTGFVTRDAFMRNVMNSQNFTYFPEVMRLIKEAEKLFADLQKMESVMPLQDEERLFIEAIRDMNHQASRMQAEERHVGQEGEAVGTEGAEAGAGEGVDSKVGGVGDDGISEAKNALSGELSGELSVEAGEAGEGEAVVKTESASAGVRVRVGGGLGVCGTPPAVMVDGVDMSMSEDGEGGDIISCLDAASASVVDAALRLHGQQPTSSSPNLFSITSWLHTQQLHQDEQAKGGERESKTESEAHKGKGEKGEEGSPVVAPRSAGSPPGNTGKRSAAAAGLM